MWNHHIYCLMLGNIRQPTTEHIILFSIVKPFIDALNDNAYRIDKSSTMEFVYFVFDKGCKRYFDDVFAFLSRFRFDNLSISEQKKYQKFVIDSISNDEIRTNCSNIFRAAQTLRQQEMVDHKVLDDAVKKYDIKFYEDTYLLNIGEYDDKKLWKYIESFVNEIIRDNQTQGKGGVYTGRAYDPYLTVGNILINERLVLKSTQLKKIVDALQGTIFARNQTIEAKYRALELLGLLQLNLPLNRQIKKLYQKIEDSVEEVLESKDVLLVKGYDQSSLIFVISLIGIMLGNVSGTEFGKYLVNVQNDEVAVQITILHTIEKMLRVGFEKSTYGVSDIFFQFLLNESYSMNNDVRFRAMSVLIKMKNPNYQEICMDRFIRIMDEEPYKIKVGLLYRFNEDDIKNPQVKYIFDKGRTDTHYWVRVAASRFRRG